MVGACKFGESCYNSHDVNCRFHQVGNCRHGSSCKFLHNNNNSGQQKHGNEKFRVPKMNFVKPVEEPEHLCLDDDYQDDDTGTASGGADAGYLDSVAEFMAAFRNYDCTPSNMHNHRSSAPGPKFGKWEDHTKGMGSLLMRKMGWVGAGLGAREQGRVELVTARMYPAGRSLDWCMQMRARFGDSVCQDVEEEAELQKQLVLQADKFGDFSFVSEFMDMRLEGGNNTEAQLRKSHELLRALKQELREPGTECVHDDDTDSETEDDSDDEDYLFESDSSSDFGFDGRAYFKHNGYRIYSDGDYEYDTYGIDDYD